MISIVVPVYNMEAYLPECLASIVAQRCQDFEVLLVDDGSKDNSLAVCQEWAAKDARFRVFSQENAGVSVARNRALEEAKGEYVCFVDADDAIAPDYLALLLELTRDGSFPLCWYTRDKATLGADGGKLDRYEAKQFIRYVVTDVLNHANLWMMLFKRDIIREHGIRFTPGCVRNEDTEFYIHYLLYEQKVVVSDYKGYYYRPNPTSVMKKPMSVRALTSIEAAERINKMLFDAGIIDDDKLILSDSVLIYAYSISKHQSKEVYAILHERYDVKAAMKKMLLSFPRRKKKFVAITYLLLGRKAFFRAIGAARGTRTWKLLTEN